MEMARANDVESVYMDERDGRQFALQFDRDIEPMLVKEHYVKSQPLFKTLSGRIKNW